MKKFDKKSELNSIAGIHATLLAIIVASLSAYTLFISENVRTIQEKAAEEAKKLMIYNFTAILMVLLRKEWLGIKKKW